MLKKIFGWIFVICGIFIVLGGLMAVLGGAKISVLFTLLTVGLIAARIGWQMRGTAQQ